MKILSVKASNFASYKILEFDFQNQGLTLIQGPTGSGKSTLCDLIPWCLYGKTAKGGEVADVLSWPGDQITSARIVLSNGIEIMRIRSGNSRHNDLYFADMGHIQRGKDLNDTQMRINALIGMDYDLYLASSYYHEFSQTAQFFTTTAKSRRVICEQLVDLSLAKTLQTKSHEELKLLNHKQSALEYEVKAITGRIAMIERLQASENTKAKTWDTAQEAKKQAAMRNFKYFEANRKTIISNKCNSCGTVLEHPHEVINTAENPYTNSILDLETQVNPYTGNVKDYSMEIAAQYADQQKSTEESAQLSIEILDLELLQQVTQAFRSTRIESAINFIEGETSRLLTEYFDAELKVKFEIEQADKLEVSIFKDGNQASYTQLSKGQRCLVKLCFGAAVMKAVSNHHGIQPQQLFFDEALDGLSEEFKVKAYSLLEALSLDYSSVFVVEHSSELKARFSNSFNVELTNEGSVIAKT